ncbi:MAG: MarR family transcriptional regulator [Ignavibacteriae bacterium]|nr:MarR family transcriptional regulator [Ignavibacteriota bacterium]
MKTTKQYGKKADKALSMWVKLARAAATFGQLTDEDIRRYGVTQAQFGALETLGHLGPLTLGELCKKQLVSGGNMTVVVDNLEKEELVERIPSTEDRRVVLVQLTKKGKRLFDEIFVQHAQCVADLASVLTEEEQDELGRLSKKLGMSLQKRL